MFLCFSMFCMFRNMRIYISHLNGILSPKLRRLEPQSEWPYVLKTTQKEYHSLCCVYDLTLDQHHYLSNVSLCFFSCLKFGHRRLMLCGISLRQEPISIKICQKEVSNDVCILSSIFNYFLQLTISGNFPEIFLKVFLSFFNNISFQWLLEKHL